MEEEDGKVEDENKDEKKKTVTETYEEWDKINVKKPLWLEDPKDISNEKYNDFYKHISNDYNDFGAVKHFTVEGQLDFTCLLFIPKQVPFDMFEPNKKKIILNYMYVEYLLQMSQVIYVQNGYHL